MRHNVEACFVFLKINANMMQLMPQQCFKLLFAKANYIRLINHNKKILGTAPAVAVAH